MFGKMSSSSCGISVYEYLDKWNIFIIVVAVVFSTSLPKRLIRIIKGYLNKNVLSVARDICLLLLLLLSIMEVVTSTYQSFIYFHF